MEEHITVRIVVDGNIVTLWDDMGNTLDVKITRLKDRIAYLKAMMEGIEWEILSFRTLVVFQRKDSYLY